jgi:VWFA-related protein
MAKLTRLLVLTALILPLGSSAQEDRGTDAVFRVEVDMVLLNIAVTDKRGNYVTGLRPWDFQVSEDGIKQSLATFGEGSEAPRLLAEFTQGRSMPQLVRPYSARVGRSLRDGPIMPPMIQETPESVASMATGASVYVLFDTSNYMYRGFVFAQDAITEFIRSLDRPDRVAFYSYSRDFSRVVPITNDRVEVLRGVRKTVAGDDAALYNAVLMTLRDAAQVSGRKMIVVFSNGPDNASMVAPEDVRELAQAEGIPIYMISTREARHDPVSTAVFERMSASTGGKAYFAKDWQDQQRAFASIRDDLTHLYALSYYPQPNPNRGWRDIKVDLVGDHLKDFRVRTRTGYRPRLPRSGGQ